MMHQDIDGLINFVEPAALDGVTEEDLVAVIVPRWIEFERALAHQLRLQLRPQLRIIGAQINSDAGQDARQGLDIGLGVAGADTHSVQFHDLARIVLVQMTRGIIGIVEIAQHHRVIERRRQEIAEFAEREGPNRAVLIVADENADVRLVLMHVEMIEPEPGHALAQLVGRIECAQDAA